jgi:hypothetical protein
MSKFASYTLTYTLPRETREGPTEMEQFVIACKKANIDIPGIVNLSPPDQTPREKLESLLADEEFSIMSPLESIVEETTEPCHWPEREEELRQLSSEVPEALFALSILDDNGERWVEYYKNGKCQVASAIITYEKFDPKKLS